MTASPEIQEIAVITGASSGMGAATARELARRVFHVLVEAVSDSLRREIAPSGVQVVVVEPGAVRTEMADQTIAATRHCSPA